MNAQVAQMAARQNAGMYTGKDRLGTQITIAAQPGQAQVKVDPAAFRSKLRLAGAPQWSIDLVRDPDSPHVRLGRAIGNTKKGKSSKRDAEEGRTLVWVRTSVKNDLLTFVLYDLSADPSLPDGKAVSTIAVSKNGGDPLVNHLVPDPHDAYREECAAVCKRYADGAGVLNSNNIRDFINSVVLGDDKAELRARKKAIKNGTEYRANRRHGIRLIGSVSYLVPKGEDVEIFSMKDALDMAGYGVAVNSVMPHDGASFSGQVEAGLTAQIDDLLKEFETLSANAPTERERFNPAVYNDRVSLLEQIEARAAYFNENLGFNMERVAALAAEAKKRVYAEKTSVMQVRF